MSMNHFETSYYNESSLNRLLLGARSFSFRPHVISPPTFLPPWMLKKIVTQSEPPVSITKNEHLSLPLNTHLEYTTSQVLFWSVCFLYRLLGMYLCLRNIVPPPPSPLLTSSHSLSHRKRTFYEAIFCRFVINEYDAGKSSHKIWHCSGSREWGFGRGSE